MQSFLRSRTEPDGDRGRPLEFHLFRPYLDLNSVNGDAPSHVFGVELAYRWMADTHVQRLPVQSRPGVAFRRRITGVGDLCDYALDEPAALPEALQSSRWKTLCERLTDFDALGAADRSAVAGLLSTMGLFRCLASLAPRVEADDPLDIVTQARIAHAAALVERTPEAHRESVRTLERIATHDAIPVASRLGAATTLVVLHARGTLLSPQLVDRYCKLAGQLVSRLHPDDDWVDALHVSTYRRAVSFRPYLAGDIEGTREELDRAEWLARCLPTETVEQRWIHEMNLHPLLETRTIEAVWAGDLELAHIRASELAERDPLDGKVHVRLGDLRARRGETRAAAAAYLTAAALGAPYAALASCKVAELAEDISFQRLALMSAQRDDPFGVTPLERLVRLGARHGDVELQSWAFDLLDTLGSKVADSRAHRAEQAVGCAPPT